MARIGRRQHRQVTRAQLASVGWDRHAIAYRVRIGRLHPVFVDVFSLGGPPQTDKERWMAATLSYGPGALLAANAAAQLYGLLRYPIRDIHVLTPSRRKSREGITAHHSTRPVAWQRIDGIPVTGVERAILDCAITVRSNAGYRRIVRIAQADEHTTHARLVAFAAMNAGARGIARLRRELRDGPSRTRSANEDAVLEVFRRGGAPESNAKVGGEEVDLWFPRLGVVIEVDSPLHDSPAARAHDAAKQERLEAMGLTVYRLR